MVLLFFQSTNISFGFLLPNERGVSLFVTDKEKCFDTAVSTIFWHAPKYGKNAPLMVEYFVTFDRAVVALSKLNKEVEEVYFIRYTNLCGLPCRARLRSSKFKCALMFLGGCYTSFLLLLS